MLVIRSGDLYVKRKLVSLKHLMLVMMHATQRLAMCQYFQQVAVSSYSKINYCTYQRLLPAVPIDSQQVGYGWLATSPCRPSRNLDWLPFKFYNPTTNSSCRENCWKIIFLGR